MKIPVESTKTFVPVNNGPSCFVLNPPPFLIQQAMATGYEVSCLSSHLQLGWPRQKRFTLQLKENIVSSWASYHEHGCSHDCALLWMLMVDVRTMQLRQHSETFDSQVVNKIKSWRDCRLLTHQFRAVISALKATRSCSRSFSGGLGDDDESLSIVFVSWNFDFCVYDC